MATVPHIDGHGTPSQMSGGATFAWGTSQGRNRSAFTNIDGNLMVIGAPEEGEVGAAYVYQFQYSDWHLATVLPPHNFNLINDFATHVAVMKDKVAVAGFT